MPAETPAHRLVQPVRDHGRVRLEVPARAAEIAGLRRDVCSLAEAAGMSAERRAAVALAVGEACANVVAHAYVGSPEPGMLLVTASVTQAGLQVEVLDHGSGLAPRADSPGLGLGLGLITSLATGVEFCDVPTGGTEIRMSFAPEVVAGVRWAQTG